MNLGRKLTAEFLGTAFLLAVIIGSGIMGDKLSEGNNAVALLANSISTGAGLIFLILSFGNISGAHFNPAVSLMEFFRGSLIKTKVVEFRRVNEFVQILWQEETSKKIF